MAKSKTSVTNAQLSRWFFLLLATVVLFLFWRVIEPFALVLLTAGIAAIVLAPVEPRLRKIVRNEKASALLLVIAVFLGIVIPLFFVGLLMVQQASELLQIFSNNGPFSVLDPSALPFYERLPDFVQNELQTLSLSSVATTIADWAFENLGTFFSSTAQLVLNIVIFFIALYYLLVDRKKIGDELARLSPFQDQLDDKIMNRMVGTVRNIVFGALIVALIQGTLAAIGMTIFGVPGALIWGALTVIAAEVPIFGVGLVLAPAVLYLFFTGDPGAAVGFTVWSAVVVGLVDNVVSPLLIKGKTHMHALLILVSILGGLRLFGSIGFIIGPTILASVMVVVELYKNGILQEAS